MTRLIGGINGRLATAALGRTQGPTGQYGWATTTNPTIGQFNQTTDNLTGLANSVMGIFSCWYFNAEATPTDSDALMILRNFVGTEDFSSIGWNSGNARINLAVPANPVVPQNPFNVLAFTANTVLTASTWQHLLISWDLTSGNTFASDVHMYLDDTDVKPASPTTFTTGTPVEWGPNIDVAGRYQVGSRNVLNPDFILSTWYLNIAEYLDFSVVANRRKFRSAAGLPVALGVDGALPTGNAPHFYFDDPVGTLLANRGTAGAFSLSSTLVDVAGPNP